RAKGRWAQILNMSTKRERHGHGTMLIAGLEELLRREDVDVVVLYPAENGRAPAFWSSIGFGNRENSFLPEEELVPHDQVRPGTKDTPGPLLPEFDPGTRRPPKATPRGSAQIFEADPADSARARPCAHIPHVAALACLAFAARSRVATIPLILLSTAVETSRDGVGLQAPWAPWAAVRGRCGALHLQRAGRCAQRDRASAPPPPRR
ncbi:unnamed protein product, partial [Prorocentrum cordatum]